MFYNNGKNRPEGDYSTVDIILDENGNYALESDTTFGPDVPS